MLEYYILWQLKCVVAEENMLFITYPERKQHSKLMFIWMVSKLIETCNTQKRSSSEKKMASRYRQSQNFHERQRKIGVLKSAA